MPQMTKGNARQMLKRTLSRFKQVTGQRIGAVFTWEGGLSILANSNFTNFINANKDVIWKSLANCPTSLESIPAHDLEMTAKIKSDLTGCNVKTLRKIISWVIQKSVGMFRNVKLLNSELN